ncbi:MAG: ATP-binding protein [Kordiimonas sp.]
MGRIAKDVKSNIVKDFDRIYLGHLRSICLVVTCYYGLLSIAHFSFIPADIVKPIVATSVLASVVGLLVYGLVRAKKITEKNSQIAFVPVGFFGLFTIYTHIFMSQDQLQLTNAVIAIFVFGFMTLSPAIFAGMLTLSSIAYIAALVTIPGNYVAHFAFLLVASNLISVLGFTLRYNALFRATRMLDGTRRKSRRLVAASHSIQAKMKEVEQANLAKDQFVANVTHELRTPLTGAMGMLDLLKDTELTDEQSFMVETAQKSSHYLLNVVNDMLALGMIDAGKMEISEERVDLAQVTSRAVNEFASEAEAKEISLSLGRLPDTAILVKSDAKRLAQILSKLIGNAVKFTEEGGVIVSLSWAPPESDKTLGKAVWRVADTGPGIPPEAIEKMFNRFQQFDQTITRNRSGTGLGLSIVKEFVALMGGAVEVKSDVDKGAVFSISLDLSVWSEEAEKKDKPVVEEGPIELEDNRKLKVLVAEDNHINQLVIMRMLEKLGAEVTLVDNGQLAVDAVGKAKVPYDLIFMDIQMPILDGLSASKIIKLRSGNLQPIIAVTANTGDHDLQDYKNAGIEAVVGKPIDFSHFRSVILSVLDEQKKKALH